MNKYRNKRTKKDGITFDSKKEAGRYEELKLRLYAGEIRDLVLQPRFPLKVMGTLICTYVGDFQYFDLEKNEQILEDVKGVRTREYRIKKRLLWATYGIPIHET